MLKKKRRITTCNPILSMIHHIFLITINNSVVVLINVKSNNTEESEKSCTQMCK
jgi:hypothetical protein